MSSTSNQSGVDQWYSANNFQDFPFVSFANAFHPLSPEAQEYANLKTFSRRVKKGEMLLKAGDICEHVYIIRRGILRSYIKEGNKDITTWINSENDLATAITSFGLQQQPAKENIQAIEDCELYGLPLVSLEYMYITFPEMNLVGRKILERYFREAEERAFVARLTEATTKYKHFAITKPELLSRVPLKFIASYLGMTLETLSRIRSKLSRIA